MTDEKKPKKMIVLGVGIVLIALALLADVLKLGTSAGWAWKQTVVLIAGILLVLGAVKCCKCSSSKTK